MVLVRIAALSTLPAAALLLASPVALAQARQPEAGAVTRALLADLQRAGEDMASEAMTQWILASRRDALRTGVSPIPRAVRTRLEGHFPAALLDRVRYRVGNGDELGFPTNSVKTNAVAITLDDVILFRHGADAAGDIRLWAHELVHVQQYERWGVRGFARRYTRDHRAVEAEAIAGATRFASARAGQAR